MDPTTADEIQTVTAREIAAMLSLSPKTIHQWLRERTLDLTPVRPVRPYLYDLAEVNAAIEAMGARQTGSRSKSTR